MDKKLEEKLKKYCFESEINISKEQIDMFSIYMDFLIAYNRHTNLTSIVSPEGILIKHFLDSIIINRFVKIDNIKNIVDIGTGAGFPGIPIKICFPDVSLTLVDSLKKRIVFLEKLCEKLDIKADIIHSRAEELSRNPHYREKFDLALSRAVAPLSILLEYCIPYVKNGGLFVSYKGPNIEEISKCDNSFKMLNSRISGVERFNLPETGDARNFIIVEKINYCSSKYPRPTSKIIKNPL